MALSKNHYLEQKISIFLVAVREVTYCMTIDCNKYKICGFYNVYMFVRSEKNFEEPFMLYFKPNF